jgi:hypothetical protein
MQGDEWNKNAVEAAKEQAEEAGRRRPTRYVDLAVGWRMVQVSNSLE